VFNLVSFRNACKRFLNEIRNLTVNSQLTVISRLTKMLPEPTSTNLRCEGGEGGAWAADIYSVGREVGGGDGLAFLLAT
jgi:hypothetical protein